MGVTQRGSRLRFLTVLLAVVGSLLSRPAVAQLHADPALQPGSRGSGGTESIASSGIEPPDRPPVVGVLADAGLPDGFMAAVVLRPIPYLRLHGGGGTNTSSAGLRGGMAVLPLGSGPSLNLEVGHYFSGQANGLVEATVRGLGRFSSYVNRVAYTFANLHAGLEFGERRFTFFVHGGLTFVRATLGDVVPPPDVGGADGRTTVTFNRDPIVRLLTPSAKLGVIVYLP